MRWLKLSLWVVVAVLMTSGPAAAQTTGAITGRVIDSQGLSVPGVTINAQGPNLQGIVSVVSSENGDYIIPQLPAGVYDLTFNLSGFERQDRRVNLALGQTLPINVEMGPATLSETVNVVGNSSAVLTQTAQVATNFKQEMIAMLPTNRTIDAAILRGPGGSPDRAERCVLHRRRDVVRVAVHGERRDGE